jgi:hypothetical protein
MVFFASPDLGERVCFYQRAEESSEIGRFTLRRSGGESRFKQWAFGSQASSGSPACDTAPCRVVRGC